MAVIPKITKETIEAKLGFEIVSFKQNLAVVTPTYIQYEVNIVPVKESMDTVLRINNYIIQINKDGGEESV